MNSPLGQKHARKYLQWVVISTQSYRKVLPTNWASKNMKNVSNDTIHDIVDAEHEESRCVW